MYRLLFCLLALTLLSGCASTLSSGVSSLNTIDFKTSLRDGTSLRLADNNRVIAVGQARAGSVTFALPKSANISSCLSIHDVKGENVFGKNVLIQPVVRIEMQKISQDLQRTNIEFSESQKIDPRFLLANAKRRIAENRAFVDGACILPEQRPIPQRPQTRCSSRQECEQEGAAICFTQYIGEKGCAMAFSELRMPGLLSSPSCAATAAKLAGEKYELGHAVVDAITGMIDDIGGNLRDSDDLGDNILGWVIGAAVEVGQLSQARSCKNSFIEKHYEPLESWKSNVRDITSEPEKLLASCQADRNSLPSLESALITSTIPANTDRLETAVVELTKRHKMLETERLPVQFCR